MIGPAIPEVQLRGGEESGVLGPARNLRRSGSAPGVTSGAAVAAPGAAAARSSSTPRKIVPTPAGQSRLLCSGRAAGRGARRAVYPTSGRIGRISCALSPIVLLLPSCQRSRVWPGRPGGPPRRVDSSTVWGRRTLRAAASARSVVAPVGPWGPSVGRLLAPRRRESPGGDVSLHPPREPRVRRRSAGSFGSRGAHWAGERESCGHDRHAEERPRRDGRRGEDERLRRAGHAGRSPLLRARIALRPRREGLHRASRQLEDQ